LVPGPHALSFVHPRCSRKGGPFDAIAAQPLPDSVGSVRLSPAKPMIVCGYPSVDQMAVDVTLVPASPAFAPVQDLTVTVGARKYQSDYGAATRRLRGEDPLRFVTLCAQAVAE